MNKIEFRVIPYYPGAGGEAQQAVDIFIDGKPLITMVRDVEWPFAKAAGTPEIAGDYMGLLPSIVLPPAPH